MHMGLSRCKLTAYQQKRLLEYFVLEVTARSAADMLQIHPNSAALFYTKVRLLITKQLALDAQQRFDGNIELDESYFGGVRKGKRGRGAAGKVIVFGILKRGGRVYTQVVENTRTETLMSEIRRKIMPDSVVYTDSYHSYGALDVSEFVHHRINHSTHFAKGRNHINGIENFWNQAKRVLRKYNGIPRKNFHLFLKECEFRFNYGSPKQRLKTLLDWANF